MSLKGASKALSISYRQTRRIYQRFLDEGDAGLIHKGRGKMSGRGFDPNFRQTVIDQYKTKYSDFGPTLAAEKLLEEARLAVDHETLRRWLLKEGLGNGAERDLFTDSAAYQKPTLVNSSRWTAAITTGSRIAATSAA